MKHRKPQLPPSLIRPPSKTERRTQASRDADRELAELDRAVSSGVMTPRFAITLAFSHGQRFAQKMADIERAAE